MLRLLKVVVAVAALGVLAVLFVRSAQSSREMPFTVEQRSLAGWTLVVRPDADALSSWLALSPPASLAASLGREIFRRAGESVNYPTPALLPLLLQAEFDRAFTGVVMPDDIVSLARSAGLESAAFTPRCMGRRRVSEPGATTGVYFLLFDAPAFTRFRQQLVERLGAARGNASLFDPAALSPVLIVAALDGNFGRWMPLRADPDADCLAPVEAQ
jgi:hypothetical protein